MAQSKLVIALDMDTRECKVVPQIDNAEGAHELDFGRLEITEQSSVMDTAAGVGIDEANSCLKVKWFGRRHVLRTNRQSIREVRGTIIFN